MTLALAGATYAAPAEMQDSVIEVNVASVSENITVITEPNSNSSEGIQESKVAKKMTQAEKAHNAAVNDSWGGAITIIAMCIVISALAILSLLFLCFGKISETLISRKKRQSAKYTAGENLADNHEPDSGEAIAAIAAALAEHFGEGHDIEDTILTIRRMKRAYSPWNSKIYNLRVMPELHKNPRG